MTSQQNVVVVVVAVLVVLLPALCRGLTLPKIFGDGMVLQADPYHAQVWGQHDGGEAQVVVNLACQSGLALTYEAVQDATSWSATLDLVGEGEICDLTVSQAGTSDITVRNILFGDIWICSGQSNMEWGLNQILAPEDEVAYFASFDKIRMLRLAHATSPQPTDDLIADSWPNFWFTSKDTQYTQQFSAVCAVFAEYLATKLNNRAFGLIETNWGGTRIEPWSTPEGLASCDVPPYENPDSPETSNSFLYNAMIHPLLKYTIRGAIWYQGESNSGWNIDKYGCTFPAMISEWRRMWSQNSPTDPNFPFGFVQLAAWRPDYAGSEFPVVRWHQTADIGYVPNDVMQNVFMAVSLDTYDAESGIHPRNKRPVCERLSTAGLNVAYGMTDLPTNGPFPISVEFSLGVGINLAEIIYNQPLDFEVREHSGFYYCCQADYSQCDAANAWMKVEESVLHDPESNSLFVMFESCATGFAYLWNETPVLGDQALAIYASDEFRLPAAPWKKEVVLTRTLELVP